MIQIISKAQYLGPDHKGRQQGGTCAVVQVRSLDGDVRFFSLPPKDHQDAAHINYAAKILTMNTVDF
jgi:hypothetical protein